MTDGILQRLPDVSIVHQAGNAVVGEMGTLLTSLSALGDRPSESPLAALVQALEELDSRLNLDVSGLTTELPQAIQVIQQLVPEGTLEHIEAIETAYQAAQEFLQTSAIAQQVTAGNNLQSVALAVIDEALHLFTDRLADLATRLIPTEAIAHVRTVFATLEQFQAEVPSQATELVPFLSRNLVGVAPDLLQAPLALLNTAYDSLAPLDPEVLRGQIEAPQRAIATALNQVMAAVNQLDPTQAASYQTIQAHLTTTETAVRAAVQTVDTLYGQIDRLITDYPWESAFAGYADALSAVSVEAIVSVEEVVNSMTGVLEELLARLYMTLGVEDLTQQIQSLTTRIRDSFTHSGLGSIRQTLRHYLDQIQGAIAAVPTETIQQLVESMLTQVHQELQSLGIDRITGTIDQGLRELETFITSTLNDDLAATVRTAFAQILSEVRSLPIPDLIAELNRGISDLSQLITDAETALQGYMQDFTQFVARLDELSFKPISDEVIAEINALKTRLEAIQPNALSDAEKLALRAALAVVEGLDLEGQVITGLNQGFGALQGQVRQLLGEITAALNQLRDQLKDFGPDVVLQPIDALLNQGAQQIKRLNARTLMRPLYEHLATLTDRLTTLAPGQLLTPLQAPYDDMMQVVNRLDPAAWLEPLNTLYAQIDQWISVIDISPLLDELDRRQRQLFAEVRSTLHSALDDLTLPEPLNHFWDGVRGVLDGLTDALFGDPDGELTRVSLELKTQFKLSSVFEPLDQVFEQLLAVLSSLSSEVLVDTMNTLREALGAGLDQLDPGAITRRLRAAQGQLADLLPTVQLSYALKLPALKQVFRTQVAEAPASVSGAIATTSAQFDTVFALLDPEQADSLLTGLMTRHQQLVERLRSRILGLNLSQAEVAYRRLRDQLVTRVPAFLRQAAPLTEADIRAGLAALRPSLLVGQVDQALDRFLTQLKPIEAALEPAINGFFTSLRETVMLINPLSLKESVEDIYETIRAKVRILDPTTVATSIRTQILDPIRAPLAAINPTQIQAQINGVFERAIAALSTGASNLLDDIAAAIQQVLSEVQLEMQRLIDQIKAVIQTVTQSLQAVVDQVEQLVFVEVLDRLNRVVDTLGVSFEQELNRVRNAFDEMLAAIPLGSSSAGASLAA